MAHLWEVAESSERHIYKQPYANQILKNINRRAATISIDLMDDEQLRELVKEATPVPKA